MDLALDGETISIKPITFEEGESAKTPCSPLTPQKSLLAIKLASNSNLLKSLDFFLACLCT